MKDLIVSNETKLLPTSSHPLLAYQKKKGTKRLINFLIIFLITVTFFCSLAIINGVYYQNWDSKIVVKISQFLPLPVVIMNNNVVYLRDYFKELSAINIFYQQQYPDQTLPQENLRMQVLTKLIEETIIKNVAAKLNIAVTNDDLLLETNKIKELAPNQDLDSLTMTAFGWNFQDFSERVLKYEILVNKLNDYFSTDQTYQAQKQQLINDIYNQVTNGEDFNNYAENLGWYTDEQISPIILEKLQQLAVGQISEIFELTNGYYILQLNNKLALSDGTNSYEIKQIFVNKYNLSDYLQAERQKLKIFRFINI